MMAGGIPWQKEAPNMGELILTLDSVTERDQYRAGNKAANLALLLRARFPVPPVLCLRTDAFDLALGAWPEEMQSALGAHILVDPAGAVQAAGAIEGLLSDLVVPPAVRDTLVGTQRIPDGAQVTVDGTLGTVDVHIAGGEQTAPD